jgi:hypothetical protein
MIVADSPEEVYLVADEDVFTPEDPTPTYGLDTWDF